MLDLHIMLTDSNSYDLVSDHSEPFHINNVWLVHLNGMPTAYEDKVVSLLQRGGIATSIQEVLSRVYWKEQNLQCKDNYVWNISQGGNVVEGTTSKIAARQVIAKVMQTNEESVEKMDKMHEIAKQYVSSVRINLVDVAQATITVSEACACIEINCFRFEIVTPYSSMIVLVNDEQRQRLKELEQRDDRFEREVETGKKGSRLWSQANKCAPLWAILVLIVMGMTNAMF